MYMGVWCGRRPAAAAGKAERKEEVRPRGAKKRAKDRVRKRERERENAVESARSRLATMIRTTIFYLFPDREGGVPLSEIEMSQRNGIAKRTAHELFNSTPVLQSALRRVRTYVLKNNIVMKCE